MYSQHFLHYKSMGKSFVAQGQVTPQLMVRTGQKSNSSEILWLSSLPASLTKIQSKKKALSSEQHFLHYKYKGKIFVNQGQVTPKPIVRSVPKSNSFEILCLSSLPASLTNIGLNLFTSALRRRFPHSFFAQGRKWMVGSKLKALAWRHRFPQNFRQSRARNSEVNGPIRPYASPGY